MKVKKITDMKIEEITFGPPVSNGGKHSVPVFFEEKSNRNKLQLNTEPFSQKYRLDEPYEEGTKARYRRTQSLRVEDAEVQAALEKMNDHVLKTAWDNKEAWFPKNVPKNEEELEGRYMPLIGQAPNKDGTQKEWSVKFKVKIENPEDKDTPKEEKPIPTKLHLMREDGSILENAGTIAMLEAGRCMIWAILSAYQVWFMPKGIRFGMSFQAEELIIKPPKEAGPLSMWNFSDGNEPVHVTSELGKRWSDHEKDDEPGEALGDEKRLKLEAAP